MDDALKNSLWNVIYSWFWRRESHGEYELASDLQRSLWANQLHEPADEAARTFSNLLKQIKQRYMAAEWWAAYDFIEFVVDYPRPKDTSIQLVAAFNAVLEKHVSAYRFVGLTLAPITSEEEITAVEQAMSHGGKFSPAVHLETALARFADRQSPDYRNSIKESISAVEAVCQILTGDPTLGKALKKIGIHPALEKGFSAIYGYTSDADGIRHALLEESTLDADDAKFFLVSCSAFVNYLIAKSTSPIPAP
jgi:hypothetical protein